MSSLVPEIVYSMKIMIPQIVALHESLPKKDYSKLDGAFGQVVTIWTFASDCCTCCG